VSGTKTPKEYGLAILPRSQTINTRRLTIHGEANPYLHSGAGDQENTIRYAEDASGKPPAIGTLYVQEVVTRKYPTTEVDYHHWRGRVTGMNKLNLFPIKLPDITWDLVFVIGLGG
jgi:hypothetical protein